MGTIEQVVILAGGKGTRMREMTEDLPKPMVKIGGIPVIEHLIRIFETNGKFNYLICTGYLEEYIFDVVFVTVCTKNSLPNKAEEVTNKGSIINYIKDYNINLINKYK